jgi:hypothetical protein
MPKKFFTKEMIVKASKKMVKDPKFLKKMDNIIKEMAKDIEAKARRQVPLITRGMFHPNSEIMGEGYTCSQCGACYNPLFNFCPDCGKDHRRDCCNPPLPLGLPIAPKAPSPSGSPTSKYPMVIARTEPSNYPLRHKILVLGEFTQERLMAFVLEVISWDLEGHLLKFGCSSGLDKNGDQVYYVRVIYASQRFKKHLLRTAEHYCKYKLHYYTGDFEMRVRVTGGEFIQPMGSMINDFRRAPKEAKAARRQRIADNQRKAQWPDCPKELNIKLLQGRKDHEFIKSELRSLQIHKYMRVLDKVFKLLFIDVEDKSEPIILTEGIDVVCPYDEKTPDGHCRAHGFDVCRGQCKEDKH